MKITIWGKHIEKIQDKSTYTIHNVRIRSYLGNKYLSTTIETVMTSSSPLRDVVLSLYQKTDSDKIVHVKEIDCISEFNFFHKCKNCAKKLQECQSKVRQCNVCGVRQIINSSDELHVSAIVYIKKENLSVTAFRAQIEQLINIYNNSNDSKVDITEKNEDINRSYIKC